MNHAQFYHHSNTNDAMVMSSNNSNNNNNISSPLKINKASYHIKKLPSSSSSSSLYNAVAATTSTTFIPHHQQQRQPVIIYTHSPKVIHTHPRDFKALVQKLTGLSPEEVSSHSHHPPQSMPMPQYHPKSEPINEEMDHDHDPISGAESCFGVLRLGDEENNYHRTNMTNINTNINEKYDLLLNDDNDSVVTDENNENNGSSCIGDNSSASGYVPPPPIFDLPNINDYKDTNSDFSNYNYNNNISDSPSFFDNNFAPFDPNPITNSSDYFFSDQQFCNHTDSLFFMPSMRNSFSSSSSESIKELPDF